jgi:hypothetical protein
MVKKIDDLTINELRDLLLNYQTKEERKKQYNRDYYKTEKGKQSILKSQKKYYAKKKLLKKQNDSKDDEVDT